MSPSTGGYQGTEDTVPLFSTAGLYVAVLAYFVGAFLSILRIKLDYWIALVLGALIGIALQYAWYGLQMIRFRRPIQDNMFVSILTLAASRTQTEGLPQIWIRKSERPILTSSANPLFSAILVSDVAAGDIVRSPVPGEAVVAEQLLMLSSASRLIAPIFVGLTTLSAVAFLCGTLNLLSLLLDTTMGMMIMSVIAAVVIVPMICLIAVISKPRASKKQNKIVDLYQMPPLLARAQVFGGAKINKEKLDELLGEFPKNVEEDSQKEWKRAIKTSLMVALLPAVVSGLLLFAMMMSEPDSILAVMAVVVFPPVFGATIFLLSFLMLEFGMVGKKREKTNDNSNHST